MEMIYRNSDLLELTVARGNSPFGHYVTQGQTSLFSLHCRCKTQKFNESRVAVGPALPSLELLSESLWVVHCTSQERLVMFLLPRT